MYFKWDLFCRHIKNGFMWLKMSLSGYFFVWERHISIQMLRCPSFCQSILPSVHPSVWSHNLVTTEKNFMKFILNMYHYNNVM